MSNPEKALGLTGAPTWKYQVVGIKKDHITIQAIVDTCAMKSAPNNDPEDGGEWEFAGFLPVDGCAMMFKKKAPLVQKATLVVGG